jgi:hypothetical protein
MIRSEKIYGFLLFSDTKGRKEKYYGGPFYL